VNDEPGTLLRASRGIRFGPILDLPRIGFPAFHGSSAQIE
jgi:hypothetical protein